MNPLPSVGSCGPRLARLTHFTGKDGGPWELVARAGSTRTGQAMKGGYLFPEENPDETALVVKHFFSAKATNHRGVIQVRIR